MDPFITTFTGRKVNPLNLCPEDVSIIDIAHHLSLLNRFVGATKHPISIAQHSVYVYELLIGSGWEREALFHDAAEAYLGDMTKWVKRMPAMEGYREAESQAWYSICDALHLRVEGDPDSCPKIREADDLMVRYECLMEISNPEHMFEIPSHPRPNLEEIKRVESCGRWYSWDYRESEKSFLDSAEDLGFEIK